MTVPHLFPYHPDPIDIFFRPSSEELLTYFDSKKFALLESAIVVDGDSYLWYLFKHPVLLIKRLVRLAIPFYDFISWKAQMSYLPNYGKKFKIICILVRRLA